MFKVDDPPCSTRRKAAGVGITAPSQISAFDPALHPSFGAVAPLRSAFQNFSIAKPPCRAAPGPAESERKTKMQIPSIMKQIVWIQFMLVVFLSSCERRKTDVPKTPETSREEAMPPSEEEAKLAAQIEKLRVDNARLQKEYGSVDNLRIAIRQLEIEVEAKRSKLEATQKSLLEIEQQIRKYQK
jgi:hypothetical protein